MHEVADARTVRRRVVRAQQGEGGTEAENGVGGERQQVGFGMVRLADRAVGIGAGGIEIAQRCRAQPAAGGGCQRALDPRLGFGIGADRRDAMGLRQQVGLRQAVDRAGAGKHQGFDAVAQRGFDQGVRLGRVVVQIALGLVHQFAHLDVAREMDHRGRAMAAEHVVETHCIADVAALERSPTHGPVVAFLQRIEADRLVARFGQRLADVAADIAGAAGDQDDAAHEAARALVPGEGFEPPTFGLQNRCTTTVLTRPTVRIIVWQSSRIKVFTFGLTMRAAASIHRPRSLPHWRH